MKKLLMTLFLLLVSAPIMATEIIGTVISVIDGDTIKVLSQNKQYKIRLSDIDAPEKSQPFGKKAKWALSEFIYNKTVSVVPKTVDRYGRIVGRVYLGNADVNASMVRWGYAWMYRKYSSDSTISEFEQLAQTERRGLWGLQSNQIMPPWEWRRGKRRRTTSIAVKKPSYKRQSPKRQSSALFTQNSSSRQCGAKRTCGQMSSCSEAMYYLNNCGVTRLDRDRDGIPCESLC